ncbi:MAG: VWA domain-containing protein [Pseudomonadota bacterium]|nr:VWA domain-containing protein [Pseudomonadota bacterium]
MQAPSDNQGRIAENIMYFARLLRSAGLPVGPGKVLDAISAVRLVGIGEQEDLYWTLFSQFVNRNDQRELFNQAFHIFWRNPHIMERMMGAMLPTIKVEQEQELEEMSRRLTEAMSSGSFSGKAETDSSKVEFDASFTFSEKEVLQEKDFEKMSAEEIAVAKQAISHLRLPLADLPTRRFKRAEKGVQIDMRATLRAALRSPDIVPLKLKMPKRRRPPLVMLCDISGSMSQYSRMFLHFMHAMTNDRYRVHCFVFGTRLTNISRYLKHRDVDVALDKAALGVKDWSGGTRIGACLKEFNNFWSRRVLTQGAITLIISDGLDRDEGDGLKKEMERLTKSSRRLIWLNPLLRFESFEPKAKGIRAMLPYVDDFKAAHNLKSLVELADVLGSQPSKRADIPSHFIEQVA